MTRKKGKSAKHARPGNKNTAKGPRIGRAILPPPRTKRPDDMKGEPRGKPFQAGNNSHDGEIFQRGRDRIPRGSIPLFYRCILSDENETLYRQVIRGIRSDPQGAGDRHHRSIQQEVARHARAGGAFEVVAKPFDMDALQGLLARAMQLAPRP